MAEDVVQETLLRALHTWPRRGVPDCPAAWLQRVARNIAIDRLRSQTSDANRAGEYSLSPADRPELEGRFEEIVRTEGLDDDQLRMMCVCCHPALSQESQVALTLKLLCGFGVEEIARGLREKPATIAQRIVRAKQTIRQEGLTFDAITEHLPEIRTAVLHVLYLLFNEGYTASGGPDLVRDHLCLEAIRLAEMAAEHPHLGGADLDALLALFYFQTARLPARVDGAGDLLLLPDQDRSKWDRALIVRGLDRLQRSQTSAALTRYHLEAGIASIHAIARSHSETDWASLIELYDALIEMTGSPVAALNRAAAIGSFHGPEAGLEALAPWRDHPSLSTFYLLHAVEGELQMRCGAADQALAAYSRALHCPCSEPERRFLERRLAEC